jgi:hypothetical protein
MSTPLEARVAELEQQVAELVARQQADQQGRSRATKFRLLLLVLVLAFYAFYLKQMGGMS